ncbi:TlpA family protein disulfide reductase [Galbibacter pacificus]|uniref:TlpA disulfide reductase family protein n=1 Tax=Galbibacter pacificus TaxID=2996052 RepID=A0ABT6FT96_9FLAO|nr:TlpA disulfide reductase family protein [Galbibacter pacificus]MDG3583018.1 TlpA disulfide reductase family protein [Galbibacter pacificus]MDG3586499.1 TlpA disulfide reductase family protein [Galbibacter pacificus]
MKKLVLLFFALPCFCISQHTISGTFAPKEQYSKVFLYKIQPDAEDYVTYISYTGLDDKGKIGFSLDEEMEPGMYQLVFGIPRIANHFDFIYDGNEDISFSFKEKEGVTFLSSEENMLLQEYDTRFNEAKQLLTSVFAPDVSKETFINVFNAIEAVQTTYEAKSEDMLANHFIKTGRIPIPEKKISQKEYNALEKEEFFKNVDFNDLVLKESFYLVNIPISYIFKFSSKNDTQSYMHNIDNAMTAIGDNPYVKKRVLTSVWNNAVADKDMEVANYISNNYLEEMSKEQGDIKLLDEIATYKRAGVGAIAPDFNLDDGRKLSDLNNAKHYLLIFWSSTCSHCLKEIPEVKKFLANKDKHTLQVVAFGLENDEHPWKDTIKMYPDFIQVYGAGKWDNATAKEYNITATPTYFVLDADKKIVAKPDSLEDLEKTINTIAK